VGEYELVRHIDALPQQRVALSSRKTPAARSASLLGPPARPSLPAPRYSIPARLPRHRLTLTRLPDLFLPYPLPQ
jgi:hypothetical protein